MIFRQFLFVPVRRQVISEQDYFCIEREDRHLVATLKDTSVSFNAPNFTTAIDKVFQVQNRFVPGSLLKAELSSETDSMIAVGGSTNETLTKLTFQNFNYKKRDASQVTVSLIGQLVPPFQKQGTYRALFCDHFDEVNGVFRVYCTVKGTTDSFIREQHGFKEYVGHLMSQIEIQMIFGKPHVKVSYIQVNSETGEITDRILCKGIFENYDSFPQLNLRYFSIIQMALEKMKKAQAM